MTPPPHVSSSSSIGKHWEAELEALKGNNAKLTAALLESTANVKQWKQQLAAYQEEAERLHTRVRRRPSPSPRRWEQLGTKDRVLCVSGDGVGVCERPNDGDQIPKDRTQPNDRRAGGGSEGQGGGTEGSRWRKRAVVSQHSPFASSFQELQRLKAEVESANEFQTQKDLLTLKLQVRETPRPAGGHTCPVRSHRDRVFVSGHGVEEPDAGGPAEGAGAASGEQPAGAGRLSQEPALAAPAAGQQDLGADGAAGHPGQAPPEQLEPPRVSVTSQHSEDTSPACRQSPLSTTRPLEFLFPT